ncbi:hypothetical protein QR98_0072270 [Sarcoptes scabiei]|uniref:Uncharacterized protein n=1 Tax=Sarcoptes scabiei TaxID=52283 RepID=A0A132ACQ7_SARSC|nr:hypothetical protein QR98_0072270 [Sarcoptes scabiei]
MLLEMMCYQALYAILNYDLYFNDVMQKLLRFDDRHLKPKSKRFLLIYFVYFGYLSGTFRFHMRFYANTIERASRIARMENNTKGFGLELSATISFEI